MMMMMMMMMFAYRNYDKRRLGSNKTTPGGRTKTTPVYYIRLALVITNFTIMILDIECGGSRAISGRTGRNSHRAGRRFFGQDGGGYQGSGDTIPHSFTTRKSYQCHICNY
jgi:hypothetical protein